MTMPDDLSPRAVELWRSTVEGYELDLARLEMLRQACEAVTMLDRLTAELEDASLTDPLQAEASEHRQLVADLLTALDLEHARTRGLRLVVDNTKDRPDA